MPPSASAVWDEVRDRLRNGQFVDAVHRLGGVEGVRTLIRRGFTAGSPTQEMARLVKVVSCGGSDLGAYVLARRLYRLAPRDPWAVATWIPYLAQRNPLKTHLTLLELDAGIGASIGGVVDEDAAIGWEAGKICTAVAFRDFESAHRMATAARERWPEHPSALGLRTATMAAEARRAEALAEVEQLLERHPQSGYLHLQRVGCLAYLERRDEAIAAVDHGLAILQNAELPYYAASLLVEAGRRNEALGYLERVRALTPLADRHARRGLLLSMLECLYLEERFDEAERVAEEYVAGNPRCSPPGRILGYAERVLAAVRDPERRQRERKVLPVPFVAQSHNTCSPASLAAIAGAWTRPGEHDEIAAEICTEGTPMELSRDWADRHGWLTAEFLPDPLSTRELIRRSIPFALHTAWLGGAHSQTVMGFDERIGTAVVREPSLPRFIEHLFERRTKVLPLHAGIGLLMVPVDATTAGLLDTLDLPKRAQLDLAHRVRLAWRKGDELAAEAAFAELTNRFPDDDVTLVLANDRFLRRSDVFGQLQATERLADRYPDDDILLRRRASLLRAVGHPERANEALERRLASRQAAPGILLDSAVEWSHQGLGATEIERVVLRAAQRGHHLAECLPFLAELRIRDGRLDEAERLLRLNSHLAPTHGGSNQMWIGLLHRIGRLDEAIAELTARSESPASARLLLGTLCMALWVSGQRSAALQRLEDAARRWPEDLEIAVMVVQYRRELGAHAQAESALAALRGKIGELEWHGEAALNADARGDRLAAMNLYRAILDIDPNSPQAWHGLRSLAEHPQALEGLADELERRFADAPRHWPLVDALVEVHAARNPGRGTAALERHLTECPWNTAAWLRLARLRQALGAPTEALAALDRACSLAPHDGETWSLAAELQFECGQMQASRSAALKSLDCGVMHPSSILAVIRTMPDIEERRAWLRARWESSLAPRPAPQATTALMYASAELLPLDELVAMAGRCPFTAPFESLHVALIRLLAREKRLSDALAHLDRMVEPYAHSETVKGLHCDVLTVAKSWAAVLSRANLWLTETPHSLAPYAHLISAYENLGQHEQALDALRRWSEAAPDDLGLARHRANVLAGIGRHDEALAILDAIWKRTRDVESQWLRLDVLGATSDAVAYGRAVRDLLPNLVNVEQTVEATLARLPGTDWQRTVWWDALKSANDESLPGVRAAWGCHAIARESANWVLRRLRKQFKSDESRRDVLEALAHSATSVPNPDLVRRIVRTFGPVARERVRIFTSLADGLWVSGKRRAGLNWLAGWKERTDLLATDLFAIARILDAFKDHEGAIAAALRAEWNCEIALYPELRCIRAVALCELGRFSEAHELFAAIVRMTASDEAIAISTWALQALEILESPTTPNEAALNELRDGAIELRRAHIHPVAVAALEALSEALRRKGIRMRYLPHAPTWWRRTRKTLSRSEGIRQLRQMHATFDGWAWWRRITRTSACRFPAKR